LLGGVVRGRGKKDQGDAERGVYRRGELINTIPYSDRRTGNERVLQKRRRIKSRLRVGRGNFGRKKSGKKNSEKPKGKAASQNPVLGYNCRGGGKRKDVRRRGSRDRSS